MRVICRRSRLMSTIAGAGAMASVELPAQQVLSELVARGVNDVVVAVVASPQSTVIGGATETVRELVAAWEQREVMAREVAVDVASHSPQVDPILDELTDALAELDPRTPEVPYYSATMFDPRERARTATPATGSDNLRHTVRFAAAVQAALEDGYRVFAELSPHPLLIHAVEQTAAGLGMPLAALRRHAPRAGAAARTARLPGGSAQRGRRDRLLGALSRRAAGGRAAAGMDPPSAALTRGGQESRAHGGHTVAVHPLLGAHVRLQEEPERHVWQAEVGTARSPGWPTTRSTTCPPFPGPPTARWRWPRPAPSSARRPRSATSASSRCCCSTTRPRSAPPRR